MPQSKHRLLDGYHLSIFTSIRPYQSTLYSGWRTISPQLTSAMDFASGSCSYLQTFNSDPLEIRNVDMNTSDS